MPSAIGDMMQHVWIPRYKLVGCESSLSQNRKARAGTAQTTYTAVCYLSGTTCHQQLLEYGNMDSGMSMCT